MKFKIGNIIRHSDDIGITIARIVSISDIEKESQSHRIYIKLLEGDPEWHLSDVDDRENIYFYDDSYFADECEIISPDEAMVELL